jgi:hypothetical protein
LGWLIAVPSAIQGGSAEMCNFKTDASGYITRTEKLANRGILAGSIFRTVLETCILLKFGAGRDRACQFVNLRNL